MVKLSFKIKDQDHLRVFAEPGLLVVAGRDGSKEVPVVDRHLGDLSSPLQENGGCIGLA